jgi:glycosyltransferase involved in cell wall biosynthesis
MRRGIHTSVEFRGAGSTLRGDVFRIRAMPSPIAFIIPALNEEAALAPMLDGLRAALDAAACADADIVVVDNCSRDATADVARRHGARVLSEPRRGYGRACLSGIAALSRAAEIIVFLDADGSDDPEDLLRLLARPATVLPTWCWARESPRRNPPARLRRNKRLATGWPPD